MSTVLMCDKCKKILENTPKNKNKPNVFVRFEETSGPNPKRTEYDICWDCYKEILTLINGDEGENNQNEQSN